MNFIKKAVAKLFGLNLELEIKEAKLKVEEELKNSSSFRLKVRDHDLVKKYEYMIGKVLISIPNEHENVRVCVGKEIQFITRANQPVLVWEDLITGEEFISLGGLEYFNLDYFLIINSMNPSDRICLKYPLHGKKLKGNYGKNWRMISPDNHAIKALSAVINALESGKASLCGDHKEELRVMKGKLNQLINAEKVSESYDKLYEGISDKIGTYRVLQDKYGWFKIQVKESEEWKDYRRVNNVRLLISTLNF